MLSADMHYSRQYGGDGRYQKADLLIVGRPAVMAAGFAISAAVNHRRKVAARREAQVRWRDHQHVQVIATTDRLLCSTDKGWLSAWYGNVTEFYPDLQSWSVTLGFEPGVAPLRLSGPPAPMICLWAATCLLGERWANDPRLRLGSLRCATAEATKPRHGPPSAMEPSVELDSAVTCVLTQAGNIVDAMPVKQADARRSQ